MCIVPVYRKFDEVPPPGDGGSELTFLDEKEILPKVSTVAPTVAYYMLNCNLSTRCQVVTYPLWCLKNILI